MVGIGADGWAGLGEIARKVLLAAPLVIGGDRLQKLLPDIGGQTRRSWPTPMLPNLPALLGDYEGQHIVVLASGDPMRSGIGTTLIENLGVGQVRVIPAVSSVSLAAARMGWSAESADVLTVVGRQPQSVLAYLTPGRRLIVLSSDEHTPALVAALLVGAGYGSSPMTVLAELGGPQESAVSQTAAQWVAPSARLNLICLVMQPDPGTSLHAVVPGLPDGAFEHDGQLTKRDLRAGALSRLGPMPGQLLWDIGAGAGSVAIEWARADPRCSAIAVERNPERAARISRNTENLGVPGVTVITGAAPEALVGLPTPDAVFIGGGATLPGVIDTCFSAMAFGGRLVVHSVTLETDALLAEHYRRLGGELIRVSVERAVPLGSFTGWTPARAVTQWSITKDFTEGQRT